MSGAFFNFDVRRAALAYLVSLVMGLVGAFVSTSWPVMSMTANGSFSHFSFADNRPSAGVSGCSGGFTSAGPGVVLGFFGMAHSWNEERCQEPFSSSMSAPIASPT